MKLSVIVPTFNESENLKKLIPYLKKYSTPDVEIIVVDGGSQDDSIAIAQSLDVKAVLSSQKGRAAQMNYAASIASGEVLQFIHADTTPPPSFLKDIETALANNYDAGCFTYAFDSNFILLKINSYFTRFNKMWCRGGDQAIFIKKSVFDALGGYINDYLIMEEYELLKRLMEHYSFTIIKKDAIVSARKYRKNNYLRVQLANLIVFNMYRLGYSQKKLSNFYRWALN